MSWERAVYKAKKDGTILTYRAKSKIKKSLNKFAKTFFLSIFILIRENY